MKMRTPAGTRRAKVKLRSRGKGDQLESLHEREPGDEDAHWRSSSRNALKNQGDRAEPER